MMSTNKLLFSTLIATFMLSGCANDWFVSHNGNMPTNERIAQVNIGQSMNEVRQVLGEPSSVVSLDRNTWIYMSSDIKRIAFFKPEEISRDVLTIKFNENEKVEDIKRLKKENGKEIVVSKDETPTLGQEPGFFEKYFGGVGQFLPFGVSRNNSI